MVTIKKNPSSRSTDTCPFCGAGVFLKHHHDNPMHDVLGIDLKNEYTNQICHPNALLQQPRPERQRADSIYAITLIKSKWHFLWKLWLVGLYNLINLFCFFMCQALSKFISRSLRYYYPVLDFVCIQCKRSGEVTPKTQLNRIESEGYLGIRFQQTNEKLPHTHLFTKQQASFCAQIFYMVDMQLNILGKTLGQIQCFSEPSLNIHEGKMHGFPYW